MSNFTSVNSPVKLQGGKQTSQVTSIQTKIMFNSAVFSLILFIMIK